MAKKTGSYRSRLKKMNAHWKKGRKKAKEQKDWPDPPAPGVYIARLTGMDIIEAGQKNALKLRSRWTVIKGESAGDEAVRWDDLERPEAFEYLARYLQRLGVESIDELDSLEEFEDLVIKPLLKERPAARLRIAASKADPDNPDWYNVYIQKTLDLDEDEDEGREESEDEEEEEGEESEEEEGEEEESEDEEEGEEEEGEEEEDFVPAYKQKVIVDRKGKQVFAKVIKVDLDEKEAKVQFDDKKTRTYPFDEITSADAEEGDEEHEEEEAFRIPAKGDKAIATIKGKEKKGVVISVSKKKETAKIRLNKTKQEVVVPFDDIELLVEPDDD